MRSLLLFAIPFFAAHTLAQATVTEDVTVEPSSTTTPVASTASVQHKQALSSAAGIASSATLASSFSPIQATSTISLSTATPSATASSSSDDDGADGSGSSIDTDAGASGSGSGSGIGNGGMIAIIVVVVLVAMFGIASTVLFVVAKRRQWNVRASIARASRRLTGRFGDKSATPNNRRTTVYAGRLGGGVKVVRPPGHKRGLVVDVNEDVEKGPLAGRAAKNTWVQRLWGNDWK